MSAERRYVVAVHPLSLCRYVKPSLVGLGWWWGPLEEATRYTAAEAVQFVAAYTGPSRFVVVDVG